MRDELHAASLIGTGLIEQLTTTAGEAREWVDRARRLVPPADRKILLNPGRLVARFARYALHHHTDSRASTAEDIAARDPELVTLLCDLFRLLGERYFRIRIEGIENLPPSGAALLVGNHSGGFLPSEGFFTALAIHDHLGPDRAVFALAHDFLFDDPTLQRYAARLGMLRAGHESAHHAFAAGHLVLVFPGSDLDTFRPFRDRHKVVLGSRRGFIKLALREHVPIVPVVTVGTHEQMIVLTRGDRLARAVHAHAWARTEVLPIILSIPWGVSLGFVPYLPLPAQTTQRFLAPLTWSGANADSPADVDRCYHDVEAAMQAAMDRMSHGRRFLRGQP